MKDSRTVAESLFAEALKSADPCRAVRGEEARIRMLAAAAGSGTVFVAGFGKAACSMARGIEQSLADMICGGMVITGYGQRGERPSAGIRVVEAGHPLPDANGVRGTHDLIELLRLLPPATFVVTLISGGGSALLVLPVAGVTLEEKQLVTRLLLESGAGIEELNCVRKHLSLVKGGGLANLLYPARSVSLILSDVIGDRIDVIASGPTAPDRTTFADALAVLRRYRLEEQVSPAVLGRLQRGAQGLVPETLKEADPAFGMVDNVIVGSNRLALDAAARAAAAEGFSVEIVTAKLAGEAGEVGRMLARRAIAAKEGGARRLCLVCGGETTVTVTGNGVGGRNQELALAAALELEGSLGITLLSAGTDGIDGPTTAAGAVVDGGTVSRARSLGLDAAGFLSENDSHTFFSACGGLLVTGPTGTNVMDLQIVLIE